MLSHSVLLVVGGALLTGLLGALVFGSNTTAEAQLMRDAQKLLRALEAQRRIRDAQLMREARKRGGGRVDAPPPAPAPAATEPELGGDAESETERRATERQRRREEKEQ